MIEILPSTNIYLASPAGVATGGPLALHQLAFKLKALEYNVFMFYNEDTEGVRVHENYKGYNLPYVFEVEDVKENVLIVPETKTRLLYSFVNIRRAIWWLSCDNFYGRPIIHNILELFGYSKPSINFTHSFSKFKLSFFKKKKFKFSDVEKFYHLTQSEYAYKYICGKSLTKTTNIAMLSDYLLPIFFEKESSNKNKEDIVLYNPLKGHVFTKKLINRGKGIKWIPIQNMTPLEVKDLLNRAKIYIDFGEHPGRDRFPREAAISGCCIITGKRGSAAFNEDLPIDEAYKFDQTSLNVPIIINKIKYVLENYESEYENFKHYREFIKGNEVVFEKEISEIFTKNS